MNLATPGEESVRKDGDRLQQMAGVPTLIAFCQDRLAKYKGPKPVRFVDTLPKSPIGKILRKELRAQAR